MQAGAFFTAENTGDYEVGSYWGMSCGIIPDVFVAAEGWHKDYVRPIGTPASDNQGRYVDDELSAHIDTLRSLPSDDPQIVGGGHQHPEGAGGGHASIEMFGRPSSCR
jgi:peptide/nickel transport system substrate-binding protein